MRRAKVLTNCRATASVAPWPSPCRAAGTLLCTLLLCTTLLHRASAQETNAPAPGKAQAIFYCFRYAPELQTVFVRIGKDSYRGVRLSSANMVGPVTATVTDGQITLHREETDLRGKKTYPLVSTVKLGSINRPLIVLVADDKADPPAYRNVVIDRADTKFPLGSYQLVNFTPHPIRAVVGSRSLEAPPGTIGNLQPFGTPGEMLNVRLTYNDGQRWRPMTTTRWALRKDRRTLLCAYLDPRDQRMKIRSVPERIITAEQSKAAAAP